ncbi:MAG: alpha/beta hydrolase-fold protein [Ignavibacteriales bacterium]|nr:alpha/beta hydrolase-fold protein [Ignavibacteriales bacterium]
MLFLRFAVFSFIWFLMFMECQSQNVQITFTVIVPPMTPKDAIVYIAGNHPMLGNWNPGGIALKKIDDSTWSRSFTFTKGQELEYKITLGSWDSQALYHSMEAPENSRKIVEGKDHVVLQPTNWQSIVFQPLHGGITGAVEYHRQLRGDGLQYARDVIVWLPPSYEKQKSKRYPVLYMHDGQNIIDPRTSFIGYDWHVDEVADSLIRAGTMEEIIVVGIYNSRDRISEYSDTDMGKAYAKFVISKVKPLIDSTYRTKPDRQNTAVMGSSMGGLISFLFVWWHPEVFSKAGCLSSVFDSRAASVLNLVRAEKKKTHDVKIYFDCGGYNGERSLKPGMDEIIELMKKGGYNEGTDFISFFDPKAEHSERAWASRVWRPLIFLFGK